MKRYMAFVLPILATFVVLGVGVLLMRTQDGALKARIRTVRDTVAELVEEAVEEVADEIKEVTA